MYLQRRFITLFVWFFRCGYCGWCRGFYGLSKSSWMDFWSMEMARFILVSIRMLFYICYSCIFLCKASYNWYITSKLWNNLKNTGISKYFNFSKTESQQEFKLSSSRFKLRCEPVVGLVYFTHILDTVYFWWCLLFRTFYSSNIFSW